MERGDREPPVRDRRRTRPAGEPESPGCLARPGRIRGLFAGIAARSDGSRIRRCSTKRGGSSPSCCGRLRLAVTVGGVVAVSWTETADFCGRCHTMDPELKAYEMSAHREVPCAECHVEPGVVGWIKAKVNGTRQLIGVLTGTSRPRSRRRITRTSRRRARPACAVTIPRRSSPTAARSSSSSRRSSARTSRIRRTPSPWSYDRPASATPSQARGLHWHIDSEVDYIAEDPRAQKIDYVAIKRADGTTEEFIASSQVTVASNVQPDIDRLSATGGRAG